MSFVQPKVKQSNCKHSRREKVLRAYYAGGDGERHYIGGLCKKCVSETDVNGLRRWIDACMIMFLPWQEWVPEAQIGLECGQGAEDVLSDDRLNELLVYLGPAKRFHEEQLRLVLQRAGVTSLKDDSERLTRLYRGNP